MDTSKVDMYLAANSKYFPPEQMLFLRDKLYSADPHRIDMLMTLDLKDPTTMLLISIFLGSLGVDRFMLGDIGMGVLKLLTMGVCGILTIIDWFTISKRARDLNIMNVFNMLQY